jgi:hypothetical protein
MNIGKKGRKDIQEGNGKSTRLELEMDFTMVALETKEVTGHGWY